MNNNISIQNLAKRLITEESNSILNLTEFIDDDFENVVKSILVTKGRVIITGIGKSAIVGQKIVATLNSTGTPAIFMHAAEAIHGDLGIVQKDDIIICISKSGNTPEIKVLVPFIKNIGNTFIAMVSNVDSYLAKSAEYVLKASVDREICPHNLTPTTSTTAQMVLGDAIAICLVNLRKFSSNDFAKYHPGGSLGKKLYLKISDLYPHNEQPQVKISDNIGKIISEITSKRLGATAVIDEKDELVGIITDGDIRRMLQENKNIFEIKAEEIMNTNAKTIRPELLAIEAFNIMEQYKITQLIVAENSKYLGMVHIHDILKEGIV